METKLAGMEIKRKNRAAIFGLFRQQRELSRQDIVDALDLSLPTVTQNLKELQEEGLIAQTGSQGHTGGRRARLYALVPNARTAIGLDVARRHVTAVALDLRGDIILTARRQAEFSRTEGYYRLLGELVEQLIREGKLDRRKVLGVGIGVPGLLSPDRSTVLYGAVLGFANVTCQELSQYIPFDTTLCHDTNAAGFAEIWNYPDTATAFYLMLNASIGGSVYIGGRQYDGMNLRSGEAGHMVIVPGGDPCYCGQRGCMDVYCASRVLSAAGDGSLEQFFRRLRQGDPRSRRVWETYLDHLSRAVRNLRMILDCNIILGGYVGSYLDEFLEELRDRMARLDPFSGDTDYLIPCRYKTEAVATGAALGYISAYLEAI